MRHVRKARKFSKELVGITYILETLCHVTWFQSRRNKMKPYLEQNIRGSGTCLLGRTVLSLRPYLTMP